MLKKAAVFVFLGFLLLNICGCFVLLAGAAGGVGTASWLSGKLTQQFQASYERTVQATESAMRSLGLKIEKEVQKNDVATFRSHYTDGKDIWIDVKRITSASTKVEVRVGGMDPDKTFSDKILKAIESHL